MIAARLRARSRRCLDESASGVSCRPTQGPALGAGNGAVAGGIGLALGPSLPSPAAPFAITLERHLAIIDSLAPTEFRDLPPDPPPDLFA